MFPSRNVRYGRFPTPAQMSNSPLGAGVRPKVEWVSILDGRTCDVCYDMDGAQRSVNNPFYPGGTQFGDQHGGGGNPAKSREHNCRCQEALVSAPRRRRK